MNITRDTHSGPLCPDIGVLAFVPDTWGEDVWQVRHQVLTRLSRYFHLVWVDPALAWRHAASSSPLQAEFSRPLADEYPQFEVYRHSKWSAKFFRPAPIANFTRNKRVRAGIDRLRQRGCKQIIAYLWRPQYADEINASDIDGYCYHIDDEYSFSTVDLPVDDRERRVIEGADHVFIHSPGMMEKKGGLNPNTTYVPNGVDIDLYTSEFEKPKELRDIETPVVMYIGVLKSMLDWDLLQSLSVKMPHVAFVFVGPMGTINAADKAIIAALSEQENVYFVGSREVHELPAYASHASVCIMPYRSNGYTKYIFPIKVNEYLAAGKPTIGTPIRTLQDYGEVITLAQTVDDWISAVDKNLVGIQSRYIVEQRVLHAREHDWNKLTIGIADIIKN